MEKAYDVKALGQMIIEEAKKDGLTLAEETAEKLAKAAYHGTKKWLKESATLSTNPFDNVVAPFYDHVDGFVLPQIEKLDLDGDGD